MWIATPSSTRASSSANARAWASGSFEGAWMWISPIEIDVVLEQLARGSARGGMVRTAPAGEGGGDDRIRVLFTRFDGNVAKIARELDMPRTSLYRRLRRLGLA